MEIKISEKHIGYFSITMIILAIFGWQGKVFYDDYQSKIDEIAQLKSDLQDAQGDLVDSNIKLSSLKGENADLEQAKLQESSEKEFAYYLATFMAEKLDELESILLEYDADSTEVIEFYSNSCYLYEPELTQANQYYAAWNTAAYTYGQRYRKILAEINELADDL